MQDCFTKWLQGWRLVGTVAVLILSAALALFLLQEQSVEGARMVIRFTARTSLLLFCFAFSASALYRLWPNGVTRWQRENRRFLGVSFAVSHGVHALGIVAFALLDPLQYHEQVPTLLPGLIGYMFIVLMTATSFDRSAAWIGRRNWKILHTVGSYCLWLAFVNAVGKRALVDPFCWPFLIALLTVVVLRLAARLFTRGAAASPSAAN